MQTLVVTDAGECAEIRPALGVYLLGAISPAERSAVDRHLAWCAECRGELTGLAALPGRLGSVPAADVARMSLGQAHPDQDERPAGALLPALLRLVARVRRHQLRRRVAVAGAVAVIASGGAVAGSRVLDVPAARPGASVVPWAATLSGSDPHTGVSAIVKYRPQPWGLLLRIQVSGVSAGTRCELRVVDASGQGVPVAGWTVAAGHAWAWYPASSPFPASDVRGFVITTARGKALVNVPAV